MEVGIVRRMLKRAKRWHLFGADIRPLKEPRSVGRALTYDEKLKLLGTAGQNEESQRAEAAMSLALCTTMRGCVSGQGGLTGSNQITTSSRLVSTVILTPHGVKKVLEQLGAI